MKSTASSRVRIYVVAALWLWLLSFAAGMVTGLTGCTGTRAAYKAAETPAEMAYAAAKHYELLLEQIDLYVHRDTADPAVKLRLQQAVAEATPVFEELASVADAYTDVKTAETEQELAEALNRAIIKLNNVIGATRGIR